MALNSTTLSAAIGSTDSTFSVASATGVTAPNFTSGAGITYAMCEQEQMLVLGLSGTLVTVQRGINGTPVAAHGASCPITFGLPADFSGLPVAIKAQQDYYPNNMGFSAPVVGANTNVATGPYFHLTGTTVMKTLTAPSGTLAGGMVGIVFDGSAAGLTWDATGNIAVAGTATTAASLVWFVFDQGSGKWHPSRLA